MRDAKKENRKRKLEVLYELRKITQEFLRDSQNDSYLFEKELGKLDERIGLLSSLIKEDEKG